jgi:hypothetical protein
MSIQQCDDVLLADERRRAREKLLDLRTLRHAIASSLSKEGFEQMKKFAGELDRMTRQRDAVPGYQNKSAEARSNRRAAAAALRSLGAT